MATNTRQGALTSAAMGSSAVIMAYQVASRATRDTLFLSNHSVSSLPVVVAIASVLSIAVALLTTRAMVTVGPVRFLPMALLASALLTIGEWLLAVRQPGITSIVVYLHVAAISPVLISGFWSILNEQFDPRTAKQAIGRIAGVGTLGGLAGGLLAERLAAWTGVPGTLPALALAQAWCAWNIRGLPAAGRTTQPVRGERLPAQEAGRRLLRTPYLRNLALLVIGCSVSNTLLDFVFKAQTAGAVHQSQGLMQVFATFYAAVAVLTFVIQALFSQPALERAGLAPTIGTLPVSVIVGSVSATLIPGPWSVGLARALEGIVRGSLFRAGYELLYTPVPQAEKRATKTLVDIACDRIGDVVGAGITALVLFAAPIGSTSALLGLAALIAAVTLGLVAQLQRGYVSSLEAGLRAGGLDLEAIDVGDLTTRTMLLRTVGRAVAAGPGRERTRANVVARESPPPREIEPAAETAAPGATLLPAGSDPMLDKLRALRSKNPREVRAALAWATPLDAALVPDAIRLLAWDEVAQESIAALRFVASRHVGELTDALLDPDVDAAVRRRIPGVLVASPTARAAEGLTRGLADDRFEVRYRCGRALERMLDRERGLQVDHSLIFDAVRREATLGRQVWDSQRLLDRLERREEDYFVDEFLRDRGGRSLEHTFTLLALVLPREPLRIAFRGLHAQDPKLRGTALEYLESILPHDLRDLLWPHLEPERSRDDAPRASRDREQVLNDLLRSHVSIKVDIEALRRRHGTPSRPEDG